MVKWKTLWTQCNPSLTTSECTGSHSGHIWWLALGHQEASLSLTARPFFTSHHHYTWAPQVQVFFLSPSLWWRTHFHSLSILNHVVAVAAFKDNDNSSVTSWKLMHFHPSRETYTKSKGDWESQSLRERERERERFPRCRSKLLSIQFSFNFLFARLTKCKV